MKIIHFLHFSHGIEAKKWPQSGEVLRNDHLCVSPS
jgi:hypothetical protein